MKTTKTKTRTSFLWIMSTLFIVSTPVNIPSPDLRRATFRNGRMVARRWQFRMRSSAVIPLYCKEE